ncbi:ribokinase [Klebsormidium nitens]|uniref:Ribokinase n=1 Tax=Klebsormidium nitens TaxID=105231 RepID=A0A1Y1HNK6_KLENI|nr:ribokinase [Klebsormidium nitens]|eukprot:GAQ79613.1 ribokinase [Klebsormidium nitens]
MRSSPHWHVCLAPRKRAQCVLGAEKQASSFARPIRPKKPTEMDPLRAKATPAGNSQTESAPSQLPLKPLVVVGSINADIYVEVDRLPKPGETLAAGSGYTLPGGKGANQAACAAKLGYPTYFVGQVGEDGQAIMLRDELQQCGVRTDHLRSVSGPSGQAIVMLQPGGQNSIIIVGGANTAWPELSPGQRLTSEARSLIRGAGAVLLQREVPEEINLEAAAVAESAGVTVVLDCGGADGPVSEALLQKVSVISPNETELARLTGRPTDTPDEVNGAAGLLKRQQHLSVLVKLGEQGSLLFPAVGEPLRQPAVPAPSVVDTTGAGDTFTAAYAVATLEGRSSKDALAFAALCASLCVRSKGAMPSMPDRATVDKELKATQAVA